MSSPDDESPLQEAKYLMREVMTHLVAADAAYVQLVDVARRANASVDMIAVELDVSRRFAEVMLEGASLLQAMTAEG